MVVHRSLRGQEKRKTATATPSHLYMQRSIRLFAHEIAAIRKNNSIHETSRSGAYQEIKMDMWEWRPEGWFEGNYSPGGCRQRGYEGVFEHASGNVLSMYKHQILTRYIVFEVSRPGCHWRCRKKGYSRDERSGDFLHYCLAESIRPFT